MAEMIQITNATDTRILDITVTSPDPRQAADIANELVEQACIYLPQIMETDEPNLVESAIPPTEKSQPQHCPQCGYWAGCWERSSAAACCWCGIS